MTANDNKSYFGYLNKLVHEYNSYSRSTGKNPADADYFALNENIETNLKSPKFKVGDRVRITKYKNIFSKGYTENCKKSMWLILCWKLIHGHMISKKNNRKLLWKRIVVE